MSDSYLALARMPRQLDIIADTVLRSTTKNRSDLSTNNIPENRSDLSTAAKSKNRSDLSTTRAKRIAARRKQLGISTSALAAAARIHIQTYFAAIKNPESARPRSFDVLEAALDGFAAGETQAGKLTLCQAYLRTITVQLAVETGWSAELMLAQDFSSENTNDPVWLQASRLRRCAVYLAVEGLRMSRASIGRAIGVSRQAVHKSVAAIEAERERDDAFDALMGRMMLQVAGERL